MLSFLLSSGFCYDDNDDVDDNDDNDDNDDDDDYDDGGDDNDDDDDDENDDNDDNDDDDDNDDCSCDPGGLHPALLQQHVRQQGGGAGTGKSSISTSLLSICYQFIHYINNFIALCRC